MIEGFWNNEEEMNNDPNKNEQIKEFKKEIDRDWAKNKNKIIAEWKIENANIMNNDNDVELTIDNKFIENKLVFENNKYSIVPNLEMRCVDNEIKSTYKNDCFYRIIINAYKEKIEAIKSDGYKKSSFIVNHENL